MEQVSRDLERWLPVVDWEGLYEVSDLGRVRSLDRWIEYQNRWGSTTKRFFKGNMLRLRWRMDDSRPPYPSVILAVNGIKVTRVVHRLVLESFRGARPAEMEGCHNDGDATNNRLSNLRWDTKKSNAQDTISHGRNPRLNLSHCQYGHALEQPNLQPYPLKSGYRTCLACRLTNMWARYLRHPLGSAPWISESHRRYAEILHFGRPLNYRLRANHRPGGTRWMPNQRGQTWA